MPSLLTLSRIMIFNVCTWLPLTLFNPWTDQEIYWFNYSPDDKRTRRKGEKKGQHIFEHVNLQQCLLFFAGGERGHYQMPFGSVGMQPSLTGMVGIFWIYPAFFFFCQRVSWIRGIGLWFPLCYNLMSYLISSHWHDHNGLICHLTLRWRLSVYVQRPFLCVSAFGKLACLYSNIQQSSPIYSSSNYMHTTPGSANYLSGH